MDKRARNKLLLALALCVIFMIIEIVGKLTTSNTRLTEMKSETTQTSYILLLVYPFLK